MEVGNQVLGALAGEGRDSLPAADDRRSSAGGRVSGQDGLSVPRIAAEQRPGGEPFPRRYQTGLRIPSASALEVKTYSQSHLVMSRVLGSGWAMMWNVDYFLNECCPLDAPGAGRLTRATNMPNALPREPTSRATTIVPQQKTDSEPGLNGLQPVLTWKRSMPLTQHRGPSHQWPHDQLMAREAAR